MQDFFEDIAGNNGKSGFFFTISFLFGYLAKMITQLTVNNLGFALLGVFSVLVLLVDIRMAVLIAIIIAMIDVGMQTLI